MARKILLLLVSLLVLSVQVGVCAAFSLPNSQPAAQIPVIKAKSVNHIESSLAQLTNFRWAAHTDSVTGTNSMRLVLDVSDQVVVDSNLATAPNPRIIITLKGTQLGNIAEHIDFSSDIVDKISFSAIDRNSIQMIIELPKTIDESDFKVFTLPANLQLGKSSRVVIDVNKGSCLPATINFTAGIKNKIIALDPGHGGSDPGAIGPNKVTEKAVTLAVTQKLQAMLEKLGAKVIMTRKDDCDVYAPNDTAVQELSARITIAKEEKADIFISVHANAYNDRNVGGMATYYFPKTEYDLLLAQTLQAGIMQNQKLQDRGVNQANFYVIKRSAMPAALVEMAFISNPAEEKLLNTSLFQQQIAQGIVTGLERFFAQVTKQGGRN